MDIHEIEQAAERMKNVVHQLPLERSETFSRLSGGKVYLKSENRQKTGSFKVRGAYNKIAKLRESGWTGTSVVACSAGNHAQGVAYAARQMGISATIVMPRTAPLAKISATESYGAAIELFGEGYDDTYERALQLVEEQDAVLIPAFDDDDIIAGQGTVSLEILRELPTVDIVLAPCGGGGLLSGMAAGIKQINPRVRVIGVQAQGADAVVCSFRGGEWTCTDTANTIADGIAVRKPGKRTVELIRQYVDDMIAVSDAEIADAILLLMERCKQVVEPAGAAAAAALISRKLELSDKKVVCVLSGGNIDVGFIHRIVERGLVQRGRRLQFHVILSDSPGSLQKFCQIVSEQGGNILLLEHDRLNDKLSLNQAVLHATIEVAGRTHGKTLVLALEKGGYNVVLD